MSMLRQCLDEDVQYQKIKIFQLYAASVLESEIAMNSPIRGTAADIMKIAMTKVNKTSKKKKKLQSRIVLQVHDELLLEVPIAECEAVKTLLVEQMQSAANLRVPLEVSVSVGNSWYETK